MSRAAIQTLDWEKVVEGLREEATANLKQAELFVSDEESHLWTARVAAAHTLFGLANAIGRSIFHVPSED